MIDDLLWHLGGIYQNMAEALGILLSIYSIELCIMGISGRNLLPLEELWIIFKNLCTLWMSDSVTSKDQVFGRNSLQDFARFLAELCAWEERGRYFSWSAFLPHTRVGLIQSYVTRHVFRSQWLIIKRAHDLSPKAFYHLSMHDMRPRELATCSL